MSRKHLTDTLIRDALSKMPPGTPRVEWADDVAPFIRVRLSPTGAVFYWVGRNPTTRKTERHKLGILGASMGVKLARDAASKLKGAAHEGKDVAKVKRTAKRAADAGRMTVADMRDAYIARCEADGKPLSESSLRSYNSVLPRLLGEYMERPIDALDSDTLMTLVTAMGKHRVVKSKYGQPLKRGNKAGATLAVKVLARLCKVHRVTDDPTRALREERRLPAIGQRAGRLGTEEAQQLFAWLHETANDPNTIPSIVRGARMMMVAIATGWRISTIEAWQWEEIDFTAMTTKLPKNKSGHTQVIPLWPVLADMLKPLRQKSGPVFDGPWVKELVTLMPFKVSPHDARKALAALVLDLTNEGRLHSLSVELLMQHFTSVTVKHYLLTIPVPNQVRNLRPAVELVSAFVSAKIGDRKTLKALQSAAAARFVDYRAGVNVRNKRYSKDAYAKRKAKAA